MHRASVRLLILLEDGHERATDRDRTVEGVQELRFALLGRPKAGLGIAACLKIPEPGAALEIFVLRC